MTQLGYLNLNGNMLLDIPAGTATQHEKLHALNIFDVQGTPTKKASRYTQLLYSLVLIYPSLSKHAAKFLLTNPEAFLDKALIEALC